MSVSDTLRAKLEATFTPELLEIVDESELHRGHGGWREGGETHYRLHMIAAAFSGQGRLARQRAVNRALAEELAGPVHALSMELHAPGE